MVSIIHILLILIFLIILNIPRYLVTKHNSKSLSLNWFSENDLVVINGIKTHMVIKGQGEPLFFIHGSQMNLYDFRNNIDYFSRYFKVYAFDMVGCGFTDKPKGDYSPDFFASFINSIMVHYSIDKASFIASSWGGGHTLHFALKYPSKVNKLVLSSPCTFNHKMSLSNVLLSNPILGRIILFFTTRALIKNELKKAFNDTDKISKQLVNSVYAPLFTKGCINATVKSYANADFSFVEKNLEKIKAPVLLVWGSSDNIHPIWMMEKLKNRILSCTTYVIENSGHLPHNETPQLFNHRALKFLLEL